MKRKEDLELIEDIVKRTYNNRLRESLDVPYSEGEPLGYSWRLDDPITNTVTYNVVATNLGHELKYTAYRIKMHEYGHIYLNHLDGIHEELDRKMAEAIDNFQGDIIKDINEQCGIDFGKSLLDKVLDDPSLNHSLHNIAMDMEVNSTILSTEDIEDMEKSLSEMFMKNKKEELKNSSMPDEMKKEVEKELDKTGKESMIKLILPCRYHFSNGDPFPDDLTYPEYLILILRNLSQFIKSSVSIMMGGNGDTSGVSDEDLKKALQNGAQSLDDILNSLGLSDPSSDSNDQGNSGGQQSQGQDPGNSNNGNNQNSSNDSSSDPSYENVGGKKFDGQAKVTKYSGIRKDHFSPSRKIADEKRELGEIRSGGGFGCGSSGTSSGERVVTDEDEVDMAIDEVIKNTKSRVIKRTLTRNIIRNYNLGKNRSVIVPTIIPKNRINTKPKLVFIIDVSGSMNTRLVDRVLKTISKRLKKINRGLVYDIIAWSTELEDWKKDLIPGKKIPKISTGGGTSMAGALEFVKTNYDKSATFILISDFEDYLQEWVKVLGTMKDYEGWGFNYGTSNYSYYDNGNIKWPSNFSVRNFNGKRNDW